MSKQAVRRRKKNGRVPPSFRGTNVVAEEAQANVPKPGGLPAARPIAPDTTFPPGLIGVLAQDTARFSMFGASMTRIQIPPGSDIQWVLGNDITDACNRIVRGMRDTDEWLWLMGDDHAFPPFILANLLNHAYGPRASEIDAIVPVCLTRLPPFEPVLYTGFVNDEEVLRERIWLDDHPEGGLFEIHSAGTAGMLVKRHVLDAIGDPWFQKYPAKGSYLAEDLYFCDQLRAQGFRLWCDLDTKLGHITTAIVWPGQVDGGWAPGFGFPDGFKIQLPAGSWVKG